jgi:hypothetical protein
MTSTSLLLTVVFAGTECDGWHNLMTDIEVK